MPKAVKIITRKKVWWEFLAIIVLTLFCAFIAYPNLPGTFPGSSFFNKFKPHLGLDLQGGAHLVYQANMQSIASADQASALEGVREVIDKRVNAFGVSEPLVQTSGNNRLIVELPGIQDVNDAIKKIGETPLLEFKEQGEQTAQALAPQEKADAQKYNQEQLAKAKEVIAKLALGQDFAALAKEYSADPSNKDEGGELGFVSKGQLVPEFEKAIFNDLKVGQITPTPIKTSFGYHIIQKEEVKGSGDGEQVRSRHILLATKDEVNQPASTEPNWINTQLSGKNLTSAKVQFEPNSGQPTVALEFDSTGKDLFAAITKRNLQKQVGIFLDGSPISLPTVQEEITGGKAIISGKFNIVEAKLLAQRLNAGALPVPIELVSQQTVGPILGKLSLQKSIVAGIIGFLLIVIFMLFNYRIMGLVAIVALSIYSLISLAIFEMWPITLTLSGVAGFILSIGMAVDANVLIFERTKEELRIGKPLGTAIEEGFARAWLSVRDSNISSLITCAILAWFGSSIIKGFAITLFIGILVSMFSAITISRTFLRLINTKFLSERLRLFTTIKKS
ncbi:MAG: protein translocase subunit SecD [Candidatus Komeilibacteria bacterium]|nr:protein translocase subunit SecD [Candidatus Komeilibacteria bacterium]